MGITYSNYLDNDLRYDTWYTRIKYELLMLNITKSEHFVRLEEDADLLTKAALYTNDMGNPGR